MSATRRRRKCRRAASTTSVSFCRQELGRPRLSHRIRDPQRHGCGSLRLGRTDGDQDRSPVARRELRGGVPRCRQFRGSCCPTDRPSGQTPQALMQPRLERAIGVIYRPETEFASHYFQAVLPRQFDSYIWFDQDRRRDAVQDGRTRGRAGHLSVRRLMPPRSWSATTSATSKEARLDAGGAHLAERSSLSVDGRLRCRLPRISLHAESAKRDTSRTRSGSSRR